jgi:hypothetical protein
LFATRTCVGNTHVIRAPNSQAIQIVRARERYSAPPPSKGVYKNCFRLRSFISTPPLITIFEHHYSVYSHSLTTLLFTNPRSQQPIPFPSTHLLQPTLPHLDGLHLHHVHAHHYHHHPPRPLHPPHPNPRLPRPQPKPLHFLRIRRPTAPRHRLQQPSLRAPIQHAAQPSQLVLQLGRNIRRDQNAVRVRADAMGRSR